MVKVIDKVREIGKRIPFLDKNGREFCPATKRADVKANGYSFVNVDKPVETQKPRTVRGIWRGHDNRLNLEKENDCKLAKTDKSHLKKEKQHRNPHKKDRRCRKSKIDSPKTMRDREEAVAWCKLMYEREYSTSTVTSSDSSFEVRRKCKLSRSKRPKLTRSMGRRLTYNDDSTTTLESPASAKTAPITNKEVTFRNPIYTTLYVPQEEIDSPASAKTAPVNAKVTTREPVYTTLYSTPQAHKRKSSSGKKKFVDGQLKLRITAQDGQLTVTAFELVGLLQRRDAESSAYVRVSIQPDFPQKERYRTKSVPITPYPAIFNETFILNVPEIDTGRRLLISVWEAVKGSKYLTFTGCMSFSAKKLLLTNKVVEGWYQLLGETLGKKKHASARTHPSYLYRSKENDCGEFVPGPQKPQPEFPIDGYHKNCPQIERSRQVRFQFQSKPRRESSCETVKTNKTDVCVKRTKLRNPSAMKSYESDTGRSGTVRRQRQDRKSYIGRSPVRPKWRKRNSIADSPKFVTDARVVKSNRSKPAKVISRRHQQLRLRGNSSNVKVLYTDETECATHLSNSTSTTSGCKNAPTDESQDINQYTNKDKVTSSKEQEIGDPTLNHHPLSSTIPTMTSGMQVQKDNKGGPLSDGDHLTDGPSFEHLTVTKSGRVKERKQMRSPTLFRATHVGQAFSDNEGRTILHETDASASKEAPYKKEHLYASIEDMRQEMALAKSATAANQQPVILKSPIRRSRSSGEQLPPTPSKRDFNMNFTQNRKRNSNTDSGIFAQLDAAGGETKTAELHRLNEENQKGAKLKNNNRPKTNEKENKEPLSTTKDADVPLVLTKGSIFSASAKRANKKSFRQSKKLSTCDPSKANELSLKELLKSKAALNAFREFLTSEHSTENLDFWLECESYKTMKESKLLKTAHGIFAQYLARSAPREVNMELSVRNRTDERLKNIDRETFSEAQECIFNLMKTDSYRRFLTTDKYKAVMESSDAFKLLPRIGSARRK